MFYGKSDEDVNEWLTHYKRVIRFNHADGADQLANVVFSLDGTAPTWYENKEGKFDTWDRFVADISRRFGDSGAKKKRAEQTLLQRA